MFGVNSTVLDLGKMVQLPDLLVEQFWVFILRLSALRASAMANGRLRGLEGEEAGEVADHQFCTSQSTASCRLLKIGISRREKVVISL
jgi:hypothetical protein